MPEIRDVLLSIEARRFWERALIAVIHTYTIPGAVHPAKIADAALADWRERFEKAEEAE